MLLFGWTDLCISASSLFHSFSWFEEKHHHPWLRPEIFVFTFPTWSFCEPCRILWTLQFCVLCPFFMMWGQVSHLTLGDSHQRNVMRFWCLSYLVISCYLGIFLFFWSRLDITWWSSPHLCYAGLPDWPQTVLLDIERYPEIRLCHVCKIHVQYVQYVHFTHFMYVPWGWVEWVEWVESTHDSTPVISQTWSRTHGLRSGFTRVFWSFSYDLGDCTDMWCVILCDLVWLQDRNEHNYTSLTKLGSGLFVRNDLRCSQIQMPKSRKTFSNHAAQATVKMEMGHHDVESEPNEGDPLHCSEFWILEYPWCLPGFPLWGWPMRYAMQLEECADQLINLSVHRSHRSHRSHRNPKSIYQSALWIPLECSWVYRQELRHGNADFQATRKEHWASLNYLDLYLNYCTYSQYSNVESGLVTLSFLPKFCS